jgi:hypothetical protein
MAVGRVLEILGFFRLTFLCLERNSSLTVEYVVMGIPPAFRKQLDRDRAHDNNSAREE